MQGFSSEVPHSDKNLQYHSLGAASSINFSWLSIDLLDVSARVVCFKPCKPCSPPKGESEIALWDICQRVKMGSG